MKVFMIAALTADGFIGRDATHLATIWTSKEDKQFFTDKTKESGVIVMGANTYRTIGRALPGRRNIVYSPKPIDQEGIEVTEEAPDRLLNRLEKEGCQSVAICGGQTIYDMFLKAKLVDELYLTVEPLFFGEGVSLVKSSMTAQLELLDFEKLSQDTLMLHYKVVK